MALTARPYMERVISGSKPPPLPILLIKGYRENFSYFSSKIYAFLLEGGGTRILVGKSSLRAPKHMVGGAI